MKPSSSFAHFVALAILLAGAGCSDSSGPTTSLNTPAMTVLGLGHVDERITAEVSVLGNVAYTTTWQQRGANVGNAVKIWDVSGPAPLLEDSLIVSGATTLGDVQALSSPALLVVATEFAPGSIVIYSLADPVHPTELSRFSSANTTPGVHTAQVSLVGGTLYAFLSIDPTQTVPGRLVIVDLSDPTAPREVSATQMGRPFVHDVFVRDGLLFTALWNDGMVIWDIGGGGHGGSPAALVDLGGVATMNGSAHNIWWFHDPSSNSTRYAFVGEEGGGSVGSSSSGDIHVVDVSNLAQPREVAFFNVPGAGTHNFSVDEAQGILYAAYYNGGVRAIDIRGDLGGCPRDQQDLTRRCDLRKMGREMAVGLAEDPTRFVWGVEWTGDFVYASDMANGLWKLEAVHR